MVRTRFAPSPTGYLHIGGVRTALFNWLYSRRHGGSFVLRIDDTDRERNVEEALAPILAGLRWLGIDWDEGPEVGGDHGPYFQSQRLERYQAAVAELIERGAAYRDYATAEELAEERQAAQAEGRRFIYSRRFKADSDEESARFEAEGRQAVVRLRMPREGSCKFHDHIRGEVEMEWAREQDHVIQRADGSCLYNLTSVVDDRDMEITHVIRAEEHLSNTPRQIFIFQALGAEPPELAHLPFVAEPGSKTKLSKRKLAKYLKDAEFAKLTEHGHAIAEVLGIEHEAEAFNPVITDFYEQVGFLPHAVVNYLLLLGWSLDDKTELFTLDEMVEHFSLERINRSPASFDPHKLLAFQEHWMMELPVDERVELVLPFAQAAGWVGAPPSDEERARLTAIVAAAGDRLKIGGDILDYPDLFTADAEIPYDEAAFEKRLRRPEDAATLLAAFRVRLADTEEFTADALEQLLRAYCEEKGIKLGAVIHALRVAVTGKAVGFGMFETLEILGRESCLARIDNALAHLAK